ncbi:hypothetical protein ACH5RR_022798 [Cinchona calisaya]|uniref:SWIM-type domain-containing protein n=1 Tax=Cinchona calisaya TaxID=153742 RepID=A0ABD2Z8T7_9GENT
MQDIAEIDLDATKWLDKKSPNEWTRSHFKTLPKCDMLLNNIYQSFNNKILDKDFIVSMMEFLRKYIMKRMQENRDRANARWRTHRFCPKIMKRMKKNIEHATTIIPHKANDTLYEVACPYGDIYAVNISERTCFCRKWDLTGIPCPHAISAIWISIQDLLDFIDDCYKVETYLRCYEPTIIPLYGEQDWEKTNAIALLPPTYGRLLGRPKKCRRKGEDKMTQRRKWKKKIRRFGQVIKWTYCSEKGHNIRSCMLRKEKEAAKDVVTQEPSAAAVSESAKKPKVSKRTRGCSRNLGGMCYLTQETLTQGDAPGTQEACAVAIPNSPKGKKARISKGKEKKGDSVLRKGENTQEAAMEDTQETAVDAAFGYRVADDFKRLYDALETLTCTAPAKEPDLFQVFGIEKSVTTHSSQLSKGKRNSREKVAQGTWKLP